MTVDIAASGAGDSVLRLQPLTRKGRAWVRRNVSAEPWQWLGAALAVDHRWGPDILAGALESGLRVTLDGREPRA